MKKILVIFFLLCNQVRSQDLQSFLNYASFQSDDGPFLETYLSIDANTIKLNKKNDGFSGTLEVNISLSTTSNVIYSDSYFLESPKFDSLSSNLFFIDQQRISLENGEYSLEVNVSDIKANYVQIHKHDIIINYNDVSLSDIQLIDSYSVSDKGNILNKSGYDLTPFVSNFYPKSINKLIFYFETYNTNLFKDNRYLINTYIESFESNRSLFDYNKIIRLESSKFQSKLLAFDISKLPTGNYNLVCEIKNSQNKSISIKKIFFQRSNHFTTIKNENDFNTINLNGTFVNEINDKDSLRVYIDYLYPISTPNENIFAQNQLEYNDFMLMKKFFFNFWQERNPLNPRKEWVNYLKKIKNVNNEFGYFKVRGYLSDRGRVYLQYGAPNTRQLEIDSKDNRPYEIWHYYKLRNRSDRKFVFIDNNRTGEYKLEFSNVNGEESNLEWIDRVDQDNFNNSNFRKNYINPR